ncbi:hypothetical protein [Streptomyces sp. PT12]|uniref:hypothetical protein n=1 Tax=Streptomyces sp. PT12 TaxID=1510197 RepID=UPI0015EF3DAC|nr:hypothetical protein [Streptomyces sp. PT12]
MAASPASPAPISQPDPKTPRRPLPLLASCGCGSGCSCGCQSGSSCQCGGNCG